MHSTSVWDLIQIYRMCLSNPSIKSHRQELWAKGISEASTDGTVEWVSQNYLSAICVAMRIQVNLHLHIHGNHNAHTQQLFPPADAWAHGTHMLSQSCGHGVECTVNNKGAHSPTSSTWQWDSCRHGLVLSRSQRAPWILLYGGRTDHKYIGSSDVRFWR
jgi:hypothetical protein